MIETCTNKYFYRCKISGESGSGKSMEQVVSLLHQDRFVIYQIQVTYAKSVFGSCFYMHREVWAIK